MSEVKDWKYQVSIKSDSSVLMNATAENKEEFDQRIADTIALYHKYFDLGKEADQKEKPTEAKTPETKPAPTSQCQHDRVQIMRGHTAKGDWVGKKCLSCGMVCFAEKDGSYKKWLPAKK